MSLCCFALWHTHTVLRNGTAMSVFVPHPRETLYYWMAKPSSVCHCGNLSCEKRLRLFLSCFQNARGLNVFSPASPEDTWNSASFGSFVFAKEEGGAVAWLESKKTHVNLCHSLSVFNCHYLSFFLCLCYQDSKREQGRLPPFVFISILDPVLEPVGNCCNC